MGESYYLSACIDFPNLHLLMICVRCLKRDLMFPELLLLPIIHTTYHTVHSVSTHMSHSGSADTFWVGDMTLNVMVLILKCQRNII